LGAESGKQDEQRGCGGRGEEGDFSQGEGSSAGNGRWNECSGRSGVGLVRPERGLEEALGGVGSMLFIRLSADD
jgi:hypothetical protein